MYRQTFIVSVNLIAILITGLAAMSRIWKESRLGEKCPSTAESPTMKEKRIIGLRVFDEPEHGINYISSCWALPRILTVVRKHHDILCLIAPISCNIHRLVHLRKEEYGQYQRIKKSRICFASLIQPRNSCRCPR